MATAKSDIAVIREDGFLCGDTTVKRYIALTQTQQCQRDLICDEDDSELVIEPCSTQVRDTRTGIEVRTREEVCASTTEALRVYVGLMIGDYLRNTTVEEEEIQLKTLPNTDEWARVLEKM